MQSSDFGCCVNDELSCCCWLAAEWYEIGAKRKVFCCVEQSGENLGQIVSVGDCMCAGISIGKCK